MAAGPELGELALSGDHEDGAGRLPLGGRCGRHSRCPCRPTVVASTSAGHDRTGAQIAPRSWVRSGTVNGYRLRLDRRGAVNARTKMSKVASPMRTLRQPSLLDPG